MFWKKMCRYLLFIKTFILSLMMAVGLVASSCKKESGNMGNDRAGWSGFEGLDIENDLEVSPMGLERRDSIVRVLKDYYARVWEDGNLSGGILVARGNDVLLERYRGFAQPNLQEPITGRTPMHVASVSKTLTAMLTLKLVEVGRLGLDQKVSSILSGFPYSGVTVFHLLSHRSGLPKYEHFIEKIPEIKKIRYLTNQNILDLLIQYHPEPVKKAGEGFMYCNTNYALLALIIERVAHRPFPEVMRRMVFQPLGMKDSYIFQPRDTLRATKTFIKHGKEMVAFSALDMIYGDKNVYTSPRDLHRFSMAMFHRDFLRKDLMQKVFRPYSNEKQGVNNYGLGFRMKIYDNGEKITFHNGWWHGTNAVFVHLLKSKTSIIAIGNVYSSKVYSAVAVSGLFEDFPVEREKLWKEIHPNPIQSR